MGEGKTDTLKITFNAKITKDKIGLPRKYSHSSDSDKTYGGKIRNIWTPGAKKQLFNPFGCGGPD